MAGEMQGLWWEAVREVRLATGGKNKTEDHRKMKSSQDQHEEFVRWRR